jgi:hypothetical protein
MEVQILLLRHHRRHRPKKDLFLIREEMRFKVDLHRHHHRRPMFEEKKKG